MDHVTHHYCWHHSPVGPLLLAGTTAGLTHVLFGEGPRPSAPAADWHEDAAAFDAARGQLDEYFAGTRRAFDLPLAPAGTPFQRAVWSLLRAIPFGDTRCYRDLAVAMGKPGAMRAVGLANGRNPLSIVVPCHRVIGSDGSLTGFGGGLEAKRFLLDHEQRVLGRATPTLFA